MQQDGQSEAVELQPRHDDRQQVVGEAKIERRSHVGTARFQVPVAQLYRETLRGPPARQRGLLVGVFVEIEMRMVALDVGVRARRLWQAILLSGPHATRLWRRLLVGFVSPRALPHVGRRNDWLE